MTWREPRPVVVPPGPGQQSVWDYPRPPRLEPTSRRIRVELAGVTVADTVRGMRVLETSHPPAYYVPATDVRTDLLRPSDGTSHCEWKGAAAYLDIVVGDAIARQAAWTYPRPQPPYEVLADHLAFYPGRVDAAWIDDEPVIPQPGSFYGGWITSDVVGPFKGEPGSEGW